MKRYEKGQVCWRFWHGILSLVTITGTVAGDIGYNVNYASGLFKGQDDVATDGSLYAFPDDRDRLLAVIDKEIESLHLYKKHVIEGYTVL